MTVVTIDVPANIDKKISFLKVERNIGSKSSMIVEILDEYFKNVEKDRETIDSI
jgi:hypothetical protein